ncbi:1,4-alpha-glucan branching protein GlgB [Paracoccus sp. p4-l81]|uniref:1,4-alpha-glucan branching protein GlgB n=1 Tax=Paracoccus sp. p4-l81 TaxID=3342806 RepID=UPI0035BACBE0
MARSVRGKGTGAEKAGAKAVAPKAPPASAATGPARNRYWHRRGALPWPEGCDFAVWAPNARDVCVIGDFNGWQWHANPLSRGDDGVWRGWVHGARPGQRYKYGIIGSDGQAREKADPVALQMEVPPGTASIIRDLPPPPAPNPDRARRLDRAAPISAYEVHLPSWDRHADGSSLNWDELAARLIPYAAGLNFTHLELLPISEYPFGGSWGYQPVGMFAPTGRLGDPDGLRRFVAAAHAAGLGVILDWVPGHFPTDAHGLAHFDGPALYEYADPRLGYHQDWNTHIYDFGRWEVADFLTESAVYWVENYNIDALRVDAVASMLYRDYSRDGDNWLPNVNGGNENYEAADLLRRVARALPHGAVTIAEESTAYAGVTLPPDAGGLGFTYKWAMGWMNDGLRYLAEDPINRFWHHNLLTFFSLYRNAENFLLPISHDEVVHGKGTLLTRIPEVAGPDSRFPTLRTFLALMWATPGKKLLFMGQEFASFREWNHDDRLDWWLLDHRLHQGAQALIGDLNAIYRDIPALHRGDCRPDGMYWIAADEAATSTYAFARYAEGEAPVVVLINFGTSPLEGYRLGLPQGGDWRVILNTDHEIYGGQGRGASGTIPAEHRPAHNQPASLMLDLASESAIFLTPV